MNLYSESFTNEYSSLLNNLNHMYPNDEQLESISSETVEDQYKRIQKLTKSLANQTNFNNFIKSKIKTFSHKETSTLKISESLFGKNLTLKKIFNNQSDSVKIVLWKHLHKLVFCVLENDENPSANIIDRKKKLQENFEKEKEKVFNPKETIHNLLNTGKLTPSTNDMINDIFSSFEGSLNEKNPFENIFNISNTISEKYKDKIENGEIDLSTLLDGLQTNLPGMENIKEMIDPILKMQGSKESEEQKEPIIIDENFSTANIEIGQVPEESNQPAIGNVLKSLDKTGLMNMLSSGMKNNDSDDKNTDAPLNKFMSLLTKLQSGANPEELSDIIKSDLGIDVDKINDQFKNILNKDNSNDA